MGNLIESTITMPHLKLTLISLIAFAGLLLNACSSATQETATKASTETTASNDAGKDKETKVDDKANEKKDGHSSKSHGGQVVESAPYHLELVGERHDEKALHLHFYLEKGDKHEPVSNAKVSAQVQLPDGSPKNIDFKYDPKDKNYTAEIPGAAAGRYQLRIVADLGSEKVNGRFTVGQ